jgi:hypothetical protein
MVGNEKNILVEFDYENIILVDPNKTIDDEGNVGERFLPPENLVCYANLECNLFPRTRLALGLDGSATGEIVNIASINFMKPGGGSSLTNEFYDEFTGENTIKGEGLNQPSETGQKISSTDKPTEFYFQQQTLNNKDTGLLGIQSINVTNNWNQPTVRIKMVDIRGRALFEKGENSPYATFFNFPYPIFYLTIKGYLGQAVKLQLTLNKFNCNFNSTTGNYDIDLEFMAFKYNILTSIMMSHALATPYMYNKQYKITPTVSSAVAQTSNVVTTLNEAKGLQKIKEVYSEYKAKNLIPLDFPEITIQEMIERLNRLEAYILKSFGQQDLSPLTDVDKYKKLVQEYESDVQVRVGGDSWFTKYCDEKVYWILKDRDVKVYQLKAEYAFGGGILEAVKNLEERLNKHKISLSANKTFGLPGTVTVGGKQLVTRINANGINVDDFLRVVKNSNEINFQKTYEERNGKFPTANDIAKLQLEYSTQIGISVKSLFLTSLQDITNGGTNTQTTQQGGGQKKDVTIELQTYGIGSTSTPLFVVEGDNINSFESYIKKIFAQIDEKKKLIDDTLNAALSEKISKADTGLGFQPNIRNVLAVIMASTEGFIRLMDDVHEAAWGQRQNKYRLAAVIGEDKTAPSPDSKDSVKGSDGNLIPVYPWPHYYVETNSDKGEKFELKYPGDASVKSKTKGYIYAYWPEVEFVEEYLKGRLQIDSPPNNPQIVGNNLELINRSSYNAIEYELSNVILANKEEVKFFYEMYERMMLPFYYQRFNKSSFISSQSYMPVGDAEFINLQKSLSSGSPYLIQKIKQYNLNSNVYLNFLAGISNNGVGESWQNYIRGYFNTPYIKAKTDNPFVIYDFDSFNTKVSVESPVTEDKISLYLQSTQNNERNLMDVFPFAMGSWFSSQMSYGIGSSNEGIMNTSKTLFLYDSKNLVANFNNENFSSIDKVKPVTNFLYLTEAGPIQPDILNFRTFYNNFTDSRKLFTTQGFMDYSNYTGRLARNQNTSMINTPYFVNAISKGVEKWQLGDRHPYKAAAYLLLNSLPLTTLREKYRSRDNGVEIPLDYTFAGMTKFGGLHKVPYAYILKIGSVWNRYKTYIETGEDFLDEVWKDIDVNNLYDPITNNPELNYQFNYGEFATDLRNIQLQTTQEVNGVNTTIMNVGFYPKLINDMALFTTGLNFFTGYTSQEINQKIQDGTISVTYMNNENSSYTLEKNYDENLPDQALTFNSWSVVYNDLNTKKSYVIPSVGSQLNQSKYDCLNRQLNKSKVTIPNNPAVFNGSARMFWAVSQYGYFDNELITKPAPNEWMKKIDNETEDQPAFSLGYQYSSIEDLFGTFSKEELDQFEEHFLNFSKSEWEFQVLKKEENVTIRQIVNRIQNTPNKQYLNFQLLFKELFGFSGSTNTNKLNKFSENYNTQLNTFFTNFQGFMNYEKFIKIGNPSKFNKRTFYSFALSTEFYIQDPYTFGQYELNSLPTSNGTTTLVQSQTAFPETWKTLQIYVGFSNTPGMAYTNSGSFITDFFVDNNVQFSEENIKILAPLIKMYATQKYNLNTYNGTTFLNDVRTYLRDTQNYMNVVLNYYLLKARNELPNVSEVTESNQKVSYEGEQMKFMLYDDFKALNDTWIAGTNYNETTLFEDFLFLDRASRDIGEKIIVNPFALKNMFKSMNKSASTFTFINGIILEHNMYTMMMPQWINFYNADEIADQSIPKVESTLEFGNTLFGTFMAVDTRKSSPKFLCIYNDTKSTYLNMDGNKDYRYKSDTFELRRASDNPLIESLQGKTDYAKSNRVVGFNVDIGIRNQNIFSTFSVSTNPAKMTKEAAAALDQQINQATGKKTVTQNTSLWNFYRSRSYECSVTCLGNAQIQPLMYFNLRHVPMFNGTYMITKVEHQIAPGTFKTTFGGSRQSMFSIPPIDSYVQGAIREILEDVIETRKQEENAESQSLNSLSNSTQGIITTTTTASNVIDGSAKPITQEITNTASDNPNCGNSLFSNYTNYSFVQASATPGLSPNDLKIKLLVIPSNVVRWLTFYTIYTSSYNSNEFKVFNYNLGKTQLNTKWGGSLASFFKTEYYCQQNASAQSTPMAAFESYEKSIDMMKAYYNDSGANLIFPSNSDLQSAELSVGELAFYDETYSIYAKLWLKMTDADIQTFKTSQKEKYQTELEKIKSALILANASGVLTTQIIFGVTTTINTEPTFVIAINDPNGGLWKIIDAEEMQVEPVDCLETVGANLSNYIVENGQKVQISLEDVLGEGNSNSGCPVNGAKYQFKCTLQPVLSDGTVDATRSQLIQSVYTTINL